MRAPHDHSCECGEDLDRMGMCYQCDYDPSDDPRIKQEFYIKYSLLNKEEHEAEGVFDSEFLDHILTHPHKYSILECRVYEEEV
jgi:hypothetical protein